MQKYEKYSHAVREWRQFDGRDKNENILENIYALWTTISLFPTGFCTAHVFVLPAESYRKQPLST